ncbi:MAG: hypothetical protein ABIL58_14820, partial [Pseudomonadota bacterium]
GASNRAPRGMAYSSMLRFSVDSAAMISNLHREVNHKVFIVHNVPYTLWLWAHLSAKMRRSPPCGDSTALLPELLVFIDPNSSGTAQFAPKASPATTKEGCADCS